MLNVVLWSVQGFLALFFLATGAPKLFGRGIEKWTGFSDLPRSQVVFTGGAEVLGATGLVLPMATAAIINVIVLWRRSEASGALTDDRGGRHRSEPRGSAQGLTIP